ncbi:MAG: protein kinase [bacterium]
MIGSTIHHYKIQKKIGEGGMGTVYKAKDTKLKRTVAIKFLSLDLTRKARARKRFINEAQALSVLDHPNICTIHDIGETDEGRMFFVMAYCAGETLRKKIERGPMKVEQALDFSIQIAQGLAEAHAMSIVHRDIKPANLMLAKNDVLKIVDFGLAKMAQVSLHTQAGVRFGTTTYMSPEQVRGEELDRRTDIWSFGVSLYEMLTADLPFQGEVEQAVLYAIMNKEAQPLTSLRPDLPPHLQGILDKALVKRVDERYQHVDEMLADLRRVKRQSLSDLSYQDRSTVALSSDSPTSQRKHLFRTLVLLAVLMIVFAGAWFLKQASEPHPIPIAVADFNNKTNDKELDGLSEMLITALEQSRRLSVLTRSRMFDILKQIRSARGAGNVGLINEPIAREICAFAEVNALAVVSIRKFDDLYTIDLRVIDPVADQHLFAAVEHGEGKKSIPKMIDRLSKKTHKGLKVDDIDTGRRSPAVATVITNNLEAFDHFSRAKDAWYKLQDEKAREELNKAIEIDSTFGLAYALLAYIHIGTPQEQLAKEPLNKALEYLERTPEKERFLVQAISAYFEDGPQAAVSVLEDMKAHYPDDKRAYLGSGYFSYRAENLVKAKENFNKVLQLDPASDRARALLSETVSAMK